METKRNENGISMLLSEFPLTFYPLL